MNAISGSFVGILGAVLVVLGWLVRHAKVISEIVSALPTVQRDVELLKEHIAGDTKEGDKE